MEIQVIKDNHAGDECQSHSAKRHRRCLATLTGLVCCLGRRRRCCRWRKRRRLPPLHVANPGCCPSEPLLPPADETARARLCAVIDLDETLVHSSFTFVPESDFVVDVEIDSASHRVYVRKRPHVDKFLESVADWFEGVLFTASVPKYAAPVADRLDTCSAFRHRLYREACVFHCDSYVKDLALLGRDVDRCFIIDNSPASYTFHRENAVPIGSWRGDSNDTELLELLDLLRRLRTAPSVTAFLRANVSATEPADSQSNSPEPEGRRGCDRRLGERR